MAAPSVSVPTPSVSAPIPTPTPVPITPAAPAKVGAPPEAVPLELAAVKDAFANSGNARFLDLSGRFTLEERATIQKSAEDLAFKTGSKVWLLAIPGKTEVTIFAPIHKDLHLGPRDVFFIFNGDKRHLQTTSKTVGNEVLKATNKSFYKSQVQGVVDMTNELGKVLTSATPTTATTAVPIKAPKQSKTGGAEILLVAVALAAVAWFVIKRKPTPAIAAPVARSKPIATKPAEEEAVEKKPASAETKPAAEEDEKPNGA